MFVKSTKNNKIIIIVQVSKKKYKRNSQSTMFCDAIFSRAFDDDIRWK